MELSGTTTTGLRTTFAEDRQGIALLKRALQEAFDAGLEDGTKEDLPSVEGLWDALLAILGASV